MVGFVVANFSCFFEFGRIRIPKKFSKRYGPVIPKDIVLMVDNGDRWLCEYDHMSGRIAGLENFMEFYGVGVYWFLVMTYFGKDEFGVNIYSPKCCEIFYPKILNSGANIKEKDMGVFKVPLNYSISEENDGALFFCNVSWSDFRFFRLVIRSVHLNWEYAKVHVPEEFHSIFRNWSNDERITLWLLNRCWEIEIVCCNYDCAFGIGWSEFLNEACIRLGDTCIFECTGKRLEFNFCFERQEDNDFIVVNPDLCGVKFFQILFFRSLDHGKIVLPMSLGDNFFNSLSTVVEFVMLNNETWSICYRRNPPSFIFIKEFASFYNLKENFIVVFEYLGHSRFFVRIFEQSSLEISYSKLCKASKRDDIFLKSEYEFGFVKGDSIDVIRFRNIKGIVKDYVRMVDKAYKGPNLLSLWKRKHIFGRFVIVLGSSPIDHKLNNVYIGNFERSFSKDWINGPVSRLIAHKRQWRVIVKLNRNMCKLGRGWDNFIGDNDFGCWRRMYFQFA
ncbi:hypothetical protein POM88_021271 [Heracleum sosnowskyi]|uniref:TF-B3 domain-containing protein n=1 Tax=Heracleum sosnowskyi TaxID=360622 RepID=A0AAD8MSB6_9APIA|nr:hypothetical protein POM88_021271 [Heracleum sosnowskyi]